MSARTPFLAAALLAFSCASPQAPTERAPEQVQAAVSPAPASPQPPPPAPLAPEPAREPRPWDAAIAWPSSAGTYVVRFLSHPAPMPDNETFALEAWVFDARNPERPLEDVRLSVDAEMPQHGHGMNLVPKIERAADGRFHVSGLLFHMTGEWQLYFDVTRGAITERAQYPLVLE